MIWCDPANPDDLQDHIPSFLKEVFCDHIHLCNLNTNLNEQNFALSALHLQII